MRSEAFDLRSAEERLVGDLEDGLAAGRWEAGARLPTERELSESYALGRTKVRRILTRFERAGRIVRTSGRGTFVCEPEGTSTTTAPHSVSPEALMEVRLLVEPQLGPLVVWRASQAEIDAMRDIVVAGASCGSDGAFDDLDARFHRAIACASRNPYLIELIENVHAARSSKAWSALRRRGVLMERRRIYQRQHEAIVEALDQRDAEGARRTIRAHVCDVRDNLLIDDGMG